MLPDSRCGGKFKDCFFIFQRMFIPLDLLRYQNQLRTQRNAGKLMVWGQVRRRWLISTPEEIVRQLVVLFLVEDRGYPIGLIQVEKEIKAHGVSRRFDVLCYNNEAQPILLVECKAPSIELDIQTAEQISNYNFALQVDYLLMTNGPKACCWHVDPTRAISFLKEVPLYKSS